MKYEAGSRNSPDRLRQGVGASAEAIHAQAAGLCSQAFRPGLFALVILLLVPRATFACSCIGAIPLCQSFWQADVVFSGEVLSFEQIDAKQLFGRRVARIRVDRVWRGQVRGTIEVTTGAGGGDCGYAFRPGTGYLVYAYKTKDGRFTTTICSPTKLLQKATADLAYFKEAEKPSTGGRIYGVAHFETKGSDLKPAKGVSIALAGESQTRTAVTKEDGTFEFTNLPVGEYSVHMAGASTPPWKVTLRDTRACVNVNLWAPDAVPRPPR
jgi:hypothetical protein